ncbi:MOSC domain-containing protein [Virgibacillus xinjiangensis]|uniref:MOSC domain-containing protein n=1 Tax=Virgibacillus xinjiangensis TaxID=393090 RepID=A0ABV7CSS3_9BACI
MEAWTEKVLVGRVKTAGIPADKPWESGMFKEDSSVRLWLGAVGLEGDEVADKKNHGGPEKAAFAYPSGHYSYWRENLELNGIEAGAMGENFAVKGLYEGDVCIGDTYAMGEAVVQVSQPRKPCWKPGRRFGRRDFALRIQETGRTGWYFRVLQEGLVGSGDSLVLQERPHPQWSVEVCNQLMFSKEPDWGLVEELITCPLLADTWKEPLEKKWRKQVQLEG